MTKQQKLGSRRSCPAAPGRAITGPAFPRAASIATRSATTARLQNGGLVGETKVIRCDLLGHKEEVELDRERECSHGVSFTRT